MNEKEFLEQPLERKLGTVVTVSPEQPAEVIATAQLAAKQLTNIVSQRPKKLVVNGKQYLFFEDWQTLGKFYGTMARVTSTEEIVKGGKVIGYLAKAAAVCNGYEVSSAEAECTINEVNWKNKPMFQLRSMSQTRACAKALRNCLGWVAVLAGYEAMPAEEAPEASEYCTIEQRKKIFVTAKTMGYDLPALRKIIKIKFGTESTKEISKTEAGDLIDFMDHGEVIEMETPDDSDLWEPES